jgi:hypothetical protein
LRQLHIQRGIASDVIEERGYESVLGKMRLVDLGFSKAQCLIPGIAIPISGIGGSVVNYQYCPDRPRHQESEGLFCSPFVQILFISLFKCQFK